jgi:hypothetical protein
MRWLFTMSTVSVDIKVDQVMLRKICTFAAGERQIRPDSMFVVEGTSREEHWVMVEQEASLVMARLRPVDGQARHILPRWIAWVSIMTGRFSFDSAGVGKREKSTSNKEVLSIRRCFQ